MGRRALSTTPEEKEERRKEMAKKYRQSERGKQKLKEVQKRYDSSEKGKTTRKTYYMSVKLREQENEYQN